MDGASSGVRYLSDEDCFFLENVMIDIRAYINALNISSTKTKALLFPPVSNYRRFLVHKLVEETFHKDNLATLSVGKLYGRRTVVFPAFLRHMENDAVVKTKEVADVFDDSRKKPLSVPIYRPPAARKRENIVRSKDKKTKKPDQPIYVPRARRLSYPQELVEAVQDEDKCNEVDIKPERKSKPISCEKDADDEIQFLGIVKRDNKENTDYKPNDLSKQDHDFITRYPTEDSVGFKTNSKNVKCDRPIKNVALLEAPSEQLSPRKSSFDDDVIDITSPISNHDSDDSLVLVDKPDLDEFTVKSSVPKKSATPRKTEASSSSKNKTLDVDSCDWEELFDESGEYVDQRLINELMTAIGSVSVQKATQDYRSFQTEEERSSDGECIIEVYGFPAEFKTEDLFNIFTAYRTDRGFQIVWVDDTHALAVFSSPIIADEVLNTQLPFVKTRPIKNAITKSKVKASNFVLPPVTRPKTCVSLARRLVSGHLGMKINVTDQQREAERKLLSDAREQKRLLAKQKVDAWEGTSSSGKL